MNLALTRCDGTKINLADLATTNESKRLLTDYFNDKTTYLEVLLTHVDNTELYQEFITPKMKNVVDIGANIGLFSLFVSPFCETLFSIEPTKKHFELLENLTKGFPQIQRAPIAISDKTGKQDFFCCPLNQTSNSLFMEEGGVLLDTVESVRLKDFFLQNNIQYSDFVKLDAEGAEVKILMDESFYLLNGKIKTLYVEVHGINNGPLKNSLEYHRGLLNDRLLTLGYETQLKNTDAIIATWKM